AGVDAGGGGGEGIAAVRRFLNEIGRPKAGHGRVVVNDLGIRKTDRDMTAVAAVDFVPNDVIVELFGAVVLRTRVGDVEIERIQGQTLKLNRVQVAVEVRPLQRARVVQPPDAAVVAIEESTAGIEGGCVMVDVWSAGDVAYIRPGCAAVRRAN